MSFDLSNSNDLNLSDTTVLIIGGSSGIGRGIADTLSQAKAQVIVMSRTPPSKQEEANSFLNWQPLDLSEPDESRKRLIDVLNIWGDQLDAVFYSAIYYGPKRTEFLNISEEDWRQQLNVNLHGLWLTLSLTLPFLKKRAPSLFVHLSSEVAYNAGPGRSGYAATKAAGSNLMRSLAEEDLSGQVRLVQLLPAKMVDTAGIRNRRSSDFDFSNYMKPKHFQQATLHLLTTRGEGMHGESLIVDEQGRLLRVGEVMPQSQSHHGLNHS